MRKIIFSILLLLFSSTTYAVLPPLYQSLREIDAIISDERVQNFFTSGERIEEISKNDDGYVIISNKRKVQVNVLYIPTQNIGPVKFELQFHEAQDIE